MIQSRWSQNVFLATLCVVLLLASVWGWSNGVKAAKSKRIAKDAEAIASGFAEFYKDQNRYPSTGEFEDSNLLRSYITNFPPQEFWTPNCPQSFDYYNASSTTYELRFCISKAVMGYSVGVNTIKP